MKFFILLAVLGTTPLERCIADRQPATPLENYLVRRERAAGNNFHPFTLRGERIELWGHYRGDGRFIFEMERQSPHVRELYGVH